MSRRLTLFTLLIWAPFLIPHNACTGVLAAQDSPELIIPSNHTFDVMALATSPDGKLVASSSSTNVKVWDYASGALVLDLDVDDKRSTSTRVYHMAFSHDGRYLAAPYGGTMALIDLRERRVVSRTRIYPEEGKYKSGATVIHPSLNAFYSHYSQGGTEYITRFDLATRRYNPVVQWPSRIENDYHRQTERMTWDPTGQMLLLDYFQSNEGTVANLAKKEATPYSNALAWLPNGYILTGMEVNGSITLRVYDQQANSIWAMKASDPGFGSRIFYTHSRFAVDPERNLFFLSAGSNRYVMGNYLTGAGTEKMLKPSDHEGVAIATLPNGHLLTTRKSPYRITSIDPVANKIVRRLGTDVLVIKDLATAGDRFAVTSQSGVSSLLEVTARGPRLLASAASPGAERVDVSRNGEYMVAYSDKTDLQVFKAGGTARNLGQPNGGVLGAGVDDAGNVVAIGKQGIAYFPAGSGQPRWQKSVAEGLYDASVTEVRFSPDGKTVYAATASSAEGQHVRAYATDDGRLKWDAGGQLFRDVAPSADGKSVFSHNGATEIYQLDARNGNLVKRVKVAGASPFQGDFSADGRYLLGGIRPSFVSGQVQKEELAVIETATGRVVSKLAGNERSVDARGFLAEGRALSVGFDNTVRLFDRNKGGEIAKLFFFGERDWAVLAANGRFDATPGAMKKMHYVVNNQPVPLERYYEPFYTPGLLGQLMESGGAAPVNVSVQELAPPPTIEISIDGGLRGLIVEDDEAPEIPSQTVTTESVRLKLVGYVDWGGGPKRKSGAMLQDIRLFHNGKRVRAGSERGLIVEEDVSSDDRKRQFYTIKLLPGENLFKAVALNDQGTESAPALLSIQYTAPAAAPGNDGITLHLLTIGINQYRNPKYNLNYAEADAGGVEAALKSGTRQLVNNVKTYNLRNAGATRTGILEQLATISAGADADDVFVFYYAGHGVMSEGETSDFYLVPHDVTQLYGNPTALQQKAISATELKELAAGIPARKQLYILDACQSAGAVESFAYRGAAEEKAIAQLARSTGTHWLTASGSEQFASEFDDLGHGAFTYVLLQGLAGAASGSDSKVTVNELKAYLDEHVPAMTEKYSGRPQFPASYGLGQDFPVGLR